MASTIINGPGTPMLTRGKPFSFSPGATATTQAYQFTISQLHENPNALDVLTISVVGGTGTTGLILECSIDGGTSWFSVGARPQASPFTATTLNADPAVIAAVSYDVSSLNGGVFRVGVAGITAGTATVTALSS